MAKIVTSDFRLQKCAEKRQLLVDQINQLPDDILTYIVSFLPLEEAARTSILSKRWIDVWLSAARLDFNAAAKMWEGMEGWDVDRILRRKRSREYVEWVNKVLQSHRAMALDLFRIRFNLSKSYRHDIDKWLRYAFARRVKRLELNCLVYGEKLAWTQSPYTFPHHLLGLSIDNSTAVSLPGPFGNGMNCGGLLGFESLRSLSFKGVNVAGEVVNFFLHNCHSLEYLVVVRSNCLEKLEVCGPSLALKHLEISFCTWLRSLIVCNTNIVSLKVTSRKNLVLNNVPMLVDVSIFGDHSCHLVAAPVSWISCCLSTLVVLTLHFLEYDFKGEGSKSFEVRTSDIALPQLPKLKRFTLFAQAVQDLSLIAFTAIIRASPNLEKFVLKLAWGKNIARIRTKSNKALAFPLHHLKEVEFYGYYGRTTEVELVEYFVENAVALQRIIIDPRDQPIIGLRLDKQEEEEIARNLAKLQLPKLVPSNIELLIV